MRFIKLLRSSLVASLLGLSSLTGCTSAETDVQDITDVQQTDVERQSIGNCWLYATASWVESINLNATGQAFDVSQSYWTYWHWYDEILNSGGGELQTGGSEDVSFDIIRQRGLMAEADFVPEDGISEMSSRQSSALATINRELSSGRLSTPIARSSKKLVRTVLDEAWGLSPEVRAQLTSAFGTTGTRTFLTTASIKNTKIVRAKDFKVRYTERRTNPSVATVKDTTLKVAVDEWQTAYVPWNASSRRSFQIRVQKALHDRQPVIITWSVDFNAMEGSGALAGSFNLETLKKAGAPGRQGGHMTVLEDYEATTTEFGLLAAGVTLDPTIPADAKKLEAALLPSTVVKFWRIKNSWGAMRDDRASAPGFPGYHDLYQTYLDGPIKWCPDVEGAKTDANCRGSENPWENVILPPGY